jgi:putative phosphoesterase
VGTVALLVLSDTHLPQRARRLPESVRRAAGAAELIVHAGDWVEASVLDDLLQYGPVVGVYGNNDGDDLRSRLPEVARFEHDGLRFAVVHETGAAAGREARADAAYPDTDVLLFGHSHIPWDSTTPGACACSTRARPPTVDGSRWARSSRSPSLTAPCTTSRSCRSPTARSRWRPGASPCPRQPRGVTVEA